MRGMPDQVGHDGKGGKRERGQTLRSEGGHGFASILLIIIDLNEFHIIKAMSIRELTWQIKLVVLEATNFTGF